MKKIKVNETGPELRDVTKLTLLYMCTFNLEVFISKPITIITLIN